MVRYSSKFLYRPMFKADLPHPPHVPDHNSFYTAPRSRWVPHYLVFSDKPIRFLYRPTPKVGRVFIEQAAVCKFLYRPTPKVGQRNLTKIPLYKILILSKSSFGYIFLFLYIPAHETGRRISLFHRDIKIIILRNFSRLVPHHWFKRIRFKPDFDSRRNVGGIQHNFIILIFSRE